MPHCQELTIREAPGQCRPATLHRVIEGCIRQDALWFQVLKGHGLPAVQFRVGLSYFLSAEGWRAAKRSALRKALLLVASDLRSALRPAAARS
jgi:hypothetical protein